MNASARYVRRVKSVTIISYSAVQLRLVSLGEFCCVFIKIMNFIEFYFILVTYTRLIVSIKPR